MHYSTVNIWINHAKILFYSFLWNPLSLSLHNISLKSSLSSQLSPLEDKSFSSGHNVKKGLVKITLLSVSVILSPPFQISPKNLKGYSIKHSDIGSIRSKSFTRCWITGITYVSCLRIVDPVVTYSCIETLPVTKEKNWL